MDKRKTVKEKVRTPDRKNIGKRLTTATDKTTITAEKTNHIKTEQQ